MRLWRACDFVAWLDKPRPLTQISIRRTCGAIGALTAHFGYFCYASLRIVRYERLIRIKTLSKSASVFIENPNGNFGLRAHLSTKKSTNIFLRKVS
jgi:hypothetical protein